MSDEYVLRQCPNCNQWTNIAQQGLDCHICGTSLTSRAARVAFDKGFRRISYRGVLESAYQAGVEWRKKVDAYPPMPERVRAIIIEEMAKEEWPQEYKDLITDAFVTSLLPSAIERNKEICDEALKAGVWRTFLFTVKLPNVMKTVAEMMAELSKKG